MPFSTSRKWWERWKGTLGTVLCAVAAWTWSMLWRCYWVECSVEVLARSLVAQADMDWTQSDGAHLPKAEKRTLQVERHTVAVNMRGNGSFISRIPCSAPCPVNKALDVCPVKNSLGFLPHVDEGSEATSFDWSCPHASEGLKIASLVYSVYTAQESWSHFGSCVLCTSSFLGILLLPVMTNLLETQCPDHNPEPIIYQSASTTIKCECSVLV